MAALSRVPNVQEVAFCRAVKEGNEADVRRLLLGVDINCPTCRQGPLHVALSVLGARESLRDQKRDVEKIITILFASSQQLDVDSLRESDRPLHLAAKIAPDELALKMIELLLSIGADPALPNLRRQTPAAVALSDRVARRLLGAENERLKARNKILERRAKVSAKEKSRQTNCCSVQ